MIHLQRHNGKLRQISHPVITSFSTIAIFDRTINASRFSCRCHYPKPRTKTRVTEYQKINIYTSNRGIYNNYKLLAL